ncbi:hypothetical protein CES85_3991 [Ochrobactrum quorumnocens]|uniref:Uncharacterized protein n=1 Tax=Ochrobactrum quorumnocens TaxID=271865 RepID=A0A248U9F6_9HYPH|nr:hypothetical protein [[Ochrobactrum] quorumnocens]ASV83212.1 hypothetical protein CES85_3991 [[Ochrobactrum] quorumnocens]
MRTYIKICMGLLIVVPLAVLMLSAAPAINRGHNAFKAPVVDNTEPEICQRMRGEGMMGKVKAFFAFGICNRW